MRRPLPNPRRCAKLTPLFASHYTVIFRSICTSLNSDCAPMARLHPLVNAQYSLSGDDNAIFDCVDDTVLKQCMPWSMLIELVLCSGLPASGMIAVCDNADSLGLVLSHDGCHEAWASPCVS